PTCRCCSSGTGSSSARTTATSASAGTARWRRSTCAPATAPPPPRRPRPRGRGWDPAVGALARRPVDGPSPAPELPPEADPYFRADRLSGGATLDAGFAILIGLTGGGAPAPGAGGGA